jgi:hypothetical protein
VLFIAAVSPLQGVMTEVNDTHIHKQVSLINCFSMG